MTFFDQTEWAEQHPEMAARLAEGRELAQQASRRMKRALWIAGLSAVALWFVFIRPLFAQTLDSPEFMRALENAARIWTVCSSGVCVSSRDEIGGITLDWVHDTWLNGKEVDPRTKRMCCGNNDTKLLDDSQVHAVKGGFLIDDTGEIVPYDREQPSPDGRYYISRWGGSTACFFGPLQGM